MTDWDTHIDIVGPQNEKRRFIDSGLGGPEQAFHGTLRFEAIVAMPPEISNKEGNDDARVSWCLEHWGFTGKYWAEAEDDPQRVTLSLFTEGGALDKLFEPMARMYPKLSFEITTMRSGKPFGCQTRWLLRDGRLIKMQSEGDLDAEIRQRLTPEMTGKDKQQLAKWCGTQKDLFSPKEWARQIERVIRECQSAKEAETVQPDQA